MHPSDTTALTTMPSSGWSSILKVAIPMAAIIRSRGGSYAQILLIFLASRMLLTLIGLLTLASFGDPPPVGPDKIDWEHVQHIYARWDSNWYLSIIENGYSPIDPTIQIGATSFAFFPFYPLLVIAAQNVWSLSSIAAGVLVSNLAFFQHSFSSSNMHWYLASPAG